MSFKDDFVEALRSVKRDFFRNHEDQAGQQTAGPFEVAPEAQTAPVAEPPRVENIPDAPLPVYDEEAFELVSAIEIAEDTLEDEEPAEEPDPAPYRHYEKSHTAPLSRSRDEHTYENPDTDRPYIDFGDSGLYDDEKTVISKNTVIRGSVETDDSVRLLGQVLGDIDCKANIVVAGKVRGNTSAANAYIFDAQVDGDVNCDDAITISNDAWVLGNLQAQQAEIDGKIKGNIEIRHMVSIGSSSSVLGNISADELEIKRGAFVNGQIMMYSPSRDVLDRFNRFEE